MMIVLFLATVLANLARAETAGLLTDDGGENSVNAIVANWTDGKLDSGDLTPGNITQNDSNSKHEVVEEEYDADQVEIAWFKYWAEGIVLTPICIIGILGE